MPKDNNEVKMVYITESEFYKLEIKDPDTVYFVVSDTKSVNEGD